METHGKPNVYPKGCWRSSHPPNLLCYSLAFVDDSPVFILAWLFYSKYIRGRWPLHKLSYLNTLSTFLHTGTSVLWMHDCLTINTPSQQPHQVLHLVLDSFHSCLLEICSSTPPTATSTHLTGVYTDFLWGSNLARSRHRLWFLPHWDMLSINNQESRTHMSNQDRGWGLWKRRELLPPCVPCLLQNADLFQCYS